MTTLQTLAKSGLLEILVGCLLGWLMLIPKQPWGKTLSRFVRDWKKLGGAHLDFLLLGMLQIALAEVSMLVDVPLPPWVCAVAIASAWLNVLPYLIAAVARIDPFVLGGPLSQVVAAAISAASSTSLTAALGYYVWRIF